MSSKDGSPISVTPNSWGSSNTNEKIERDIILWADHRATVETKMINETGSMVLNYVGGTMSLEMEIPKVVWLKKHMPKAVFDSAMFFDLPDYLTFRATDHKARSNCSLACKCSYVPPGVEGSVGWNDAFFRQIGLEEFASPFSSFILLYFTAFVFSELSSCFYRRYLQTLLKSEDNQVHQV